MNISQFAFGWKKYTNRNLWEKIIPLLGIKAAASFRLIYKYWPFTWHRKSDYFMHSVTYGDSFMHLDVCLGRLCQSMDLYMYIYGTCISLYCTIANMYWKQYVTLLNYIVTVTQWWKWNQFYAYFCRNESLPYVFCVRFWKEDPTTISSIEFSAIKCKL